MYCHLNWFDHSWWLHRLTAHSWSCLFSVLKFQNILNFWQKQNTSFRWTVVFDLSGCGVVRQSMMNSRGTKWVSKLGTPIISLSRLWICGPLGLKFSPILESSKWKCSANPTTERCWSFVMTGRHGNHEILSSWTMDLSSNSIEGPYRFLCGP